MLHEGPVDASLPLPELSEQRARFISDKGWDDFAHVSGSFRERDHAIQHLDYFDEVVLWFEDDLYDQLQLLQVLDFFASGAAGRKTLSLIQVDGYIPPLPKAKIQELDGARKEVNPEQLDLARRAWRAFGSNDPNQISALLQEGTSALPYIASSLRRHLEEFPSSTTGLSRSEREALTAIKSGHATPVRAFLEVARMQESIFLGDIVFYSYLERLSDSRSPLLTWKNGSRVVAPSVRDARDFVNSGEIVLTQLGRQVLAGDKDWQTLHRSTRWLGGVEIPPGAGGWRWNEREGGVMKASPSGAVPKRKSAPNRKSAPKRASKPTRKTTKARKSTRPKPATKRTPAKRKRK